MTSFAAGLRARSAAYNEKASNTSAYTADELNLVMQQAVLLMDACCEQGLYRTSFRPYLSNRLHHPRCEEFISRMEREGVRATFRSDDDIYVLDWSTDNDPLLQPSTMSGGVIDADKIVQHVPDDDDDVDDKIIKK
jgi:hypothetical protein